MGFLDKALGVHCTDLVDKMLHTKKKKNKNDNETNK